MSSKPKLLIASDCFLPRWDGVSRFLVEMFPYLKQSFDITVIAPGFEGTLKKSDDINVVQIPLSQLHVGDFSFSQWKPKKIDEEVKKADIVFCQTVGFIGGNAMRIAHKRNVPCVSYVHSVDWELASKSMSRYNLMRKPARSIVFNLARWAYRKNDLLLVPSDEVAELMKYHKIKVPTQVVPLGVDVQRFGLPLNKSEAKRKVHLRDSDPVIGYVGRLAREKDVLTLLRAFHNLKKKKPEVQLLIVGDGLSDYRAHFEKRKDVKLVGAQNDVIKYFHAMDIHVLPSLLETTSLSTLEAMSCGVVPVATPVGLIKKYITEKENGLIFPKGNSLVLSMKLEWLLDHRSKMRDMSHAARRVVVNDYTWRATAAHIVEALNSLVQKD